MTLQLDRDVKKQERRRGPDLWFKAIRWFAVSGWLLMFVALIIIGVAKPQTETFFDRSFDVDVRAAWNENLLQNIFYIMILGFVISLIGLMINKRRARRKDDELRISLVALGIISIAGIIAYLLLI